MWRRQSEWAAGLSMSVNVSPRQLREPSLVMSLSTILEATGIPAADITVEVTESAVVEDVDQARNCLTRLRSLGIRTAVDDFGSGYSSIGYLSTLPLDEIKIDRMFVSKLGEGESKDLVLALIRLVDTLSVTTIIEGIETKEQLDYATALGIDMAQGYYFSRPVGPDKIQELMTASSILAPAVDGTPSPAGKQVA
jgi:EAL domain-containing protein (putative c-di-GMP-specific phosphodiesterase class I)